jgi:hypothetical protein
VRVATSRPRLRTGHSVNGPPGLRGLRAIKPSAVRPLSHRCRDPLSAEGFRVVEVRESNPRLPPCEGARSRFPHLAFDAKRQRCQHLPLPGRARPYPPLPGRLWRWYGVGVGPASHRAAQRHSPGSFVPEPPHPAGRGIPFRRLFCSAPHPSRQPLQVPLPESGRQVAPAQTPRTSTGSSAEESGSVAGISGVYQLGARRAGLTAQPLVVLQAPPARARRRAAWSRGPAKRAIHPGILSAIHMTVKPPGARSEPKRAGKAHDIARRGLSAGVCSVDLQVASRQVLLECLVSAPIAREEQELLVALMPCPEAEADGVGTCRSAS